MKLTHGKSQTELKDDKAVEIERIYVLKDFYGKQVGQLLFNKAIEISLQKKANYIWLGVWEENPKAINFYKKMALKLLTSTSLNLEMTNKPIYYDEVKTSINEL